MLRRIALLALILASAPAPARPPAGSVRYSDLDLATPAGIAMLDRRIDRAVERLCGAAYPTDLDAQAQIAGCRSETMKSVSSSRAILLAHAGGSGAIALKGR
jgi:UrcA family protein